MGNTYDECRELYYIEDIDGEKVMHWECTTSDHPATDEVTFEDLTFCYIPVADLVNADDVCAILDRAQEVVQHYAAEKSYEDAYVEFDEWAGGMTYLPIQGITEDTPTGGYWCYCPSLVIKPTHHR